MYVYIYTYIHVYIYILCIYPGTHMGRGFVFPPHQWLDVQKSSMTKERQALFKFAWQEGLDVA